MLNFYQKFVCKMYYPVSNHTVLFPLVSEFRKIFEHSSISFMVNGNFEENTLQSLDTEIFIYLLWLV